ncbi:hypothetical protein HA45_22955 [Pantoea rodasii]|nr:hypothetical protein HA45_22955 [Pantoea rodasii]
MTQQKGDTFNQTGPQKCLPPRRRKKGPSGCPVAAGGVRDTVTPCSTGITKTSFQDHSWPRSALKGGAAQADNAVGVPQARGLKRVPEGIKRAEKAAPAGLSQLAAARAVYLFDRGASASRRVVVFTAHVLILLSAVPG